MKRSLRLLHNGDSLASLSVFADSVTLLHIAPAMGADTS